MKEDAMRTLPIVENNNIHELPMGKIDFGDSDYERVKRLLEAKGKIELSPILIREEGKIKILAVSINLIP